MKSLAVLLLLLSSIAVPSFSFAHVGHDHDHGHGGGAVLGHAHVERSKQEIFDELISYYQAILLTQRQLATEESAAATPAEMPKVFVSGTDGSKPFRNTDVMSRLFAQVARAHRLGIELDCGSECQTEQSQRELDALEKSTVQKFKERFVKGAKKFASTGKRFAVEFFPEMYQYTHHHGFSFALWLLVTEPLEHLVFSPFLGGIPICKFLYGVYFAIANPIRNFFGIALNRFDGSFQILSRLKGAMVSWIYERRFKKRMQVVLVHADDPNSQMTQKEYRKTLSKDASAMELELSRTSFWSEAYSYFHINTKDDASEQPSVRTFSDALYLDFSTIFGYQPTEVRFDRARRLIEGLRETNRVLARVLDSDFYENKNLDEPVKWWPEFFKFKGIVGQIDKLIDLYSFNLQAVALSDVKDAGSLGRWAMQPVMEQSMRDIFELFHKALPLAQAGTVNDRKAIFDELKLRTKLLIRRQQDIASGKVCKAALLVPVKLR